MKPAIPSFYRTLAGTLMFFMLTTSVAVAASDNAIDYTPRVRTDHVFTSDAPRLTMEESRVGDYRDQEVFRLHLGNAEWNNLSQMELDASLGEGVTNLQISRFTSTMIQVTLTIDPERNRPAFIGFPLYTKTTGGGYATIGIEPITGGVTGETLNFAEVVSYSPVTESTIEPEEPDEGLEIPVPEEIPVPDPVPEEIPLPGETPSIVSVQFIVGQTGYLVDGVWQESDAAPYIQSLPDGTGRLMVPVGHASRALGAHEVHWNPENKQVTVTRDNRRVQMTIGSLDLLIDEQWEKMDVPAVIMPVEGGGRTMLPVAYLAKALNVAYHWDETARTVSFYP